MGKKVLVVDDEKLIVKGIRFSLDQDDMEVDCAYDGEEGLRMAMEKLSLSARAYNRILKVARTIADLAGSEHVEPQHLAEAIGYRTLDRGDWAERGHF